MVDLGEIQMRFGESDVAISEEEYRNQMVCIEVRLIVEKDKVCKLVLNKSVLMLYFVGV